MCEQQRDLWFWLSQCNFNFNSSEISSQQLNKLWHWDRTCQQRHNPIYYWLIKQPVTSWFKTFVKAFFYTHIIYACEKPLKTKIKQNLEHGSTVMTRPMEPDCWLSDLGPSGAKDHWEALIVLELRSQEILANCPSIFIT